MATTVRCPTCGRLVEWTEAQPFRPFCGERCKLIDLGAWATETYALPAAAEQPPADPEAPET